MVGDKFAAASHDETWNVHFHAMTQPQLYYEMMFSNFSMCSKWKYYDDDAGVNYKFLKWFLLKNSLLSKLLFMEIKVNEIMRTHLTRSLSNIKCLLNSTKKKRKNWWLKQEHDDGISNVHETSLYFDMWMCAFCAGINWFNLKNRMLRAQEISKQHATEKIYFNKLQKELFAASAAALRYSNNKCEIASSHEDVFARERDDRMNVNIMKEKRGDFKNCFQEHAHPLRAIMKKSKACNLVSNKNSGFQLSAFMARREFFSQSSAYIN